MFSGRDLLTFFNWFLKFILKSMYKVCIYCTQHLQKFLFDIKFYDEGERFNFFDQSTECHPYSWTLKPKKKLLLLIWLKKYLRLCSRIWYAIKIGIFLLCLECNKRLQPKSVHNLYDMFWTLLQRFNSVEHDHQKYVISCINCCWLFHRNIKILCKI